MYSAIISNSATNFNFIKLKFGLVLFPPVCDIGDMEERVALEAGSSTWPQLVLLATVSLSHMSMPNHWLPYSLAARAHNWRLHDTLMLSKCAFQP